MKTINKRIFLLVSVTVIFAAVAALLMFSMFSHAEEYALKSINSHLYDNGVLMNAGDIKDVNGTVLAQTVDGERVYSDDSDIRKAMLHIIGDNEGFVIVSGDDSLTELVGYSDSGSFEPENMPDNMRSWLQSYSDYVKSVQDGETRPTRRELSDVTTVVVRPFVTTAWNQSEPFNLMAPVDNNVRCVTGCVATAMAQVMKYYEWPERGEGSHSYTDSSGHSLSADFSQSVYDWGNMLDEYNSYYDQNMNIVNEYNDVQADAVAKLMLDCGISVDMDYTLYSSGAVTANVATALEQYFNYTADLFYRDNMPSEDFLNRTKSGYCIVCKTCRDRQLRRYYGEPFHMP